MTDDIRHVELIVGGLRRLKQLLRVILKCQARLKIITAGDRVRADHLFFADSHHLFGFFFQIGIRRVSTRKVEQMVRLAVQKEWVGKFNI